METKRFKIVSTQSNINWVGRKVTGAYNGTVAIKEGEIVLNDGKLAGGRFIVDTSSIKVLDITDPLANAQFAGHLASDDFFSTEKYPEAIFEIVLVSDLFVAGDLTIKGFSRPAALNVAVDVNGDRVIYNDFELNVNITAKTA